MNNPARRRCPRCGRMASGGCCGLDFTVRRRPWRMDDEKIKLVHVLKARKGLDDDTYRLRLGAVGVESSKQLKRAQFHVFLKGLAALPDRPGWIDQSRRNARG